MNDWEDLPNASHIDWVLTSLKTHRKIWYNTYDQAGHQAWKQARGQASGQAWKQARGQVCSQVRDQAFGQAWGQAWGQVYDQAFKQVWGACVALIAYDDCNKYLSMTSNELEVWAKISEDPSAILLLPMVRVKEKIKEMEPVTI